ncbi:hypothetical protein C2E23DRAFT_827945 [Lenzites betulinus]|nr:hypothetical protein C2E23DRAFT_827945 [Lenzites betulinus]
MQSSTGHVFCYDCVIRLIRSITPYTPNHYCPTCKQLYTISCADPNLVPHHLKHHVTPSVRKLHLEYSTPIPEKTPVTTAECGRLLAENASLRTCCLVWRKRAAVHATATMAFVGLARLARDYGMKMKTERDEFEQKYNELKKLYDEKLSMPQTPPETPSCPPSPRSAELRSGASPLPHVDVAEAGLLPSIRRSEHQTLSCSDYRLPSPALSEESYCSDCPDCVERKRKHPEEDADDVAERPVKRSHSMSPTLPAPMSSSPDGVAIATYMEDTLSL